MYVLTALFVLQEFNDFESDRNMIYRRMAGSWGWCRHARREQVYDIEGMWSDDSPLMCSCARRCVVQCP